MITGPLMDDNAALREENRRLRQQLKYAAMLLERLRPGASQVHRAEALAMLDGTLKEIGDALKARAKGGR